MRVSVTGVPEVRVAETQALIRRALAPLQAAGVIMICAHHLNNGEWLLMGFDGVKLEALKGVGRAPTPGAPRPPRLLKLFIVPERTTTRESLVGVGRSHSETFRRRHLGIGRQDPGGADRIPSDVPPRSVFPCESAPW